MPESVPDHDPFYIGWLRMPRVFARFLAPVAVGIIIGAGVAACTIALLQGSPVTGTWDDQTTTFVGIVTAEPYAMIRVLPDEANGLPRTILLVEEGKFGAKERVRMFDGQPVRVRGTRLSRGDRLMLELAPGDDGLSPATLSESVQAKLRRPTPRSQGPVSLRGEIVDSKCYLGAMKPGDGPTHRGCAILCLKGGIPPLFIPKDVSQQTYLIVDASGTPLDSSVFDLVGQPVLLNGEQELWGDLPVLKLAGQPQSLTSAR